MAPLIQSAVIDELRSIVGEQNVLSHGDAAGYESDWTNRYSGSALAVVRPGDSTEVQAIVRACESASIAIVPQGGNTGLVGGSVPRGGEIVVSLARLGGIQDLDATVGQVTVGAGVTLETLNGNLASAGWRLAVDLASRGTATIGGMIATNAGGIYALRYGHMRRQLLGIEAVVRGGSLISRLSGLYKDNTGYDLAALYAGSEGTLGIITRARLQLIRRSNRRVVAVLAFADAVSACRTALVLRTELPTLVAAELFFRNGLELVLTHAAVRDPFSTPHACYVLVEALADDEALDDRLVALLEAAGASDVVVASDEQGARRLWELRERHTESIGTLGVPHKLDVAVRPADVATFATRVVQVISVVSPSAQVFLFGHVADGNLHVNIVGPDPTDVTSDDAVFALVTEMGGSVSAEHGIGVAKAQWLVRNRGDADVNLMRDIKRALDPRGIFNPGVIFSS